MFHHARKFCLKTLPFFNSCFKEKSFFNSVPIKLINKKKDLFDLQFYYHICCYVKVLSVYSIRKEDANDELM